MARLEFVRRYDFDCLPTRILGQITLVAESPVSCHCLRACLLKFEFVRRGRSSIATSERVDDCDWTIYSDVAIEDDSHRAVAAHASIVRLEKGFGDSALRGRARTKRHQ